MASGSRYSQQSSSIWPGYVDVLSALLMVVIFVLLIFTFSQFILTRILTSQGSELEDLHLRIAEISHLLGLEKETSAAMTEKIASLSAQVETLTIDRTTLQSEVEDLSRKRLEDRETIEVHLRTVASLQQDIHSLEALRRELESRIETAAAALTKERQLTASLRDRSKILQDRLAEEEEKTLLAQKDIEHRDIRLQALSALIGEQQEALDNQRNMTADARAEVALLNQKINQLQSQLAEIGKALKKSELERDEKDEQIQDLGKRLNIELARRVTDLERYRSEFFGRLRSIIADNPLIRIEGDRFVLQAELLFPSGTAELSENGKGELKELAGVLGGLIPAIPNDLNWILRVDGHTDRVPIRTANFASNWELSTARAVSVVRYLASQGIPEERMAATGFGKFHPIDPADTTQAYSRNRRIEMKLTSR
ncbi:MAG: flagellar motor protein MotB [Desulfobulbaceae bacterium BRH_c16a]|nr:MAG: flagellar motor protein MotB [Desulfobulbaceae bacterium BRH_c16a]